MMTRVRKSLGVLLLFFGIVTFAWLLTSLGFLMQTYDTLDKGIGIGETLPYISALGVTVTEFILGFELSGFLTKERDTLEEPKPSDKGTNILLYGVGAIAIGFIGFFIIIFVLPNLLR
jgi:hypothetical protein